MKIKTSELTGAALDWAVAKCEGILDPVHGEPQPRVVFYSDQWDRYMRLNPPPQVYYSDRYEPSTDWAQGGPIIEREKIEIEHNAITGEWRAVHPFQHKNLLTESVSAYGDTALIAAMRTYVSARLGTIVEVPEELL